jgi:hypothetical protein
MHSLLQEEVQQDDWTGYARVKYDFNAENLAEISLVENDVCWILYKQCPGWLVAKFGEREGLVPEEYVERLKDKGKQVV